MVIRCSRGSLAMTVTVPLAARVAAAQRSKVVGHPVESDLVDGLENVPDGLVGAVLGLRPEPQCGEQLRGFVDQEAPGFGLGQFTRVCLDLAQRPGEELVEP